MTNPFSELIDLDPEKTLETLEPLTDRAISIVLYFLPTDSSAKILKSFELKRQLRIIKNIEELGPLDETAMQELGKLIKAKWNPQPNARILINGKNELAKILPFTNGSLKTIILQNVPSLAGTTTLRNLPSFEALAKMPDKHFQKLLKEIDRKTLLLAIKTGADQFRSKMRNNMTKNAIELLESDLDQQGPVKKSDVLNAQDKICKLASDMEKSGALVLTDSDEWVN